MKLVGPGLAPWWISLCVPPPRPCRRGMLTWNFLVSAILSQRELEVSMPPLTVSKSFLKISEAPLRGGSLACSPAARFHIRVPGSDSQPCFLASSLLTPLARQRKMAQVPGLPEEFLAVVGVWGVNAPFLSFCKKHSLGPFSSTLCRLNFNTTKRRCEIFVF